MATNGNRKFSDEKLRPYNYLHETKTKLNENVLAYLDRNKNLLQHPVVVKINGTNNNKRTINVLDLIINVLGCILINAPDHDGIHALKATPLFNPNAMLERCFWAYPDPIYFLVPLDLSKGLCGNLHLNILETWDNHPDNYKFTSANFMVFILELVGELAKHWTFYSGHSTYPVPEFKDRKVKDVVELAKRKYSLTARCYKSMYQDEYGELRLDLAKFVLDQLIVYRMAKA